MKVIMFTVKILREKLIDFNVEICAAFIDFKKAFGRVNCIKYFGNADSKCLYLIRSLVLYIL
jgi:hypothetical protein